VSLRSENEFLRSKIASLEGSIHEMTERLVPRLELGSIAESESDCKRHHSEPRDDDTGRYVDDCEVDTARANDAASVEVLLSKLHASEGAAAKLIVQVRSFVFLFCCEQLCPFAPFFLKSSVYSLSL